MVNPATGRDTPYEELWRGEEPRAIISASVRSVVLKLEDEGQQIKGSVVLLGQYCQGLLRKGSSVTAERWQWTEEQGWKRTVALGEDELPCSRILKESELALGHVVAVGDDRWQVIETSGS